jgi:GNAT superfamily N-acetyltransferase
MRADAGSAGLEIVAVDLRSRRDRRRFLDVAAPLYRHDPHYVEPLRRDRLAFLDPVGNPALADLEIQALIARRGGRDVGRVTAHVDRAYDRHHATRAGWFGFFESIDDRAVAHALFAAAVDWARERGASSVIGPMSFNTNQECGLLVDNFARRPMIGTTYNPPYYEALLTGFGFRSVKELYGWWVDVRAPLDDPNIARIAAFAERVTTRRNVVVRSAVKKRFDEEWPLLFELYKESWRDNWGYVPISKEEFGKAAIEMLPIVREELILFVEVRGRPVGFALTVPDLNEVAPRDGRLWPLGWAKLAFGIRRIRHVRLVLLGVLPEFRRRGLESLLFVETAMRSRALGYEGGEASWTLDDNVLINRAIESMGGRLYRKYRLFEVSAGSVHAPSAMDQSSGVKIG